MKFSFPDLFYSGFIFSYHTDEIWVGWGSPCRMESPHSGENFIYAPDFFLKDQKPWWIFPYQKKYSRIEFLRSLEKYLNQLDDTQSQPHSLNQLKWKKPDYSLFRSVFLELKDQFKRKTLQKAVPVCFESTETLLDPSVLALLVRNGLRSVSSQPLYLYGLWNQGEGILGATPEILFQEDSSGSLSTVALAGTRSNFEFPVSLLNDPKELEEHRIVIEGIRQSLFHLGTVTLGKTEELKLPSLTHLITPITLQPNKTVDSSSISRDALFSELVRALHPTPALGTFPKEQGMEWLRRCPVEVDRGRFGAPFGFFSKSGEIQTLVAIRNIQWRETFLQIGAGCGIVEASQLEKEWLEINAKLDSIKKIFGIGEILA